jgi:hypothetical protein
MPIPKDKILYEKIKKNADNIYDKSSAYKSGYITRMYKLNGGEYINDNKPKKLKTWFQEEWMNINPLVSNKTGYPTYRPTIKVNKNTPKTVEELSLKRLKEQYKLKQKIKGNKNLPKF